MKAEMLLPKLTLSLPFTFLLFVQKRNVYRYFPEHIQNFFFFVSLLNSFIFQNSMWERNWWHILLFFIFFSSDHNRRRRRKLSWRRFRRRKFRSYLNDFFIFFRGWFCNLSGSQRNSAHISITIWIDNSLCWKLVRTLSLHIIYLSSKLSHLCGQGLNASVGSLLKLKVVQ